MLTSRCVPEAARTSSSVASTMPAIRSAAFVAAYAPRPGNASTAAPDDTLTILIGILSGVERTTQPMSKTGAIVLTAYARSMRAGSSWSTWPSKATSAALFTKATREMVAPLTNGPSCASSRSPSCVTSPISVAK